MGGFVGISDAVGVIGAADVTVGSSISVALVLPGSWVVGSAVVVGGFNVGVSDGPVGGGSDVIVPPVPVGAVVGTVIVGLSLGPVGDGSVIVVWPPVPVGEVMISVGEVTISVGDVTISVGDVTISLGDVMISVGDVIMSVGDVMGGVSVPDGLVVGSVTVGESEGPVGSGSGRVV